jgi:hypothetical protein
MTMQIQWTKNPLAPQVASPVTAAQMIQNWMSRLTVRQLAQTQGLA